MTASAFDPLSAVQALEAAGIDRKQAEAHAAQLRAVADAVLDQCATNADLDSYGRDLGSLRGKPGLLRGELDAFRMEFRYGMGLIGALNLVILGRLFGIL